MNLAILAFVSLLRVERVQLFQENCFMVWTKSQVSILVIVAATSFMGTFLISSVNIALPSIGSGLGIDAVSLSWVITSFLLSTAMFQLPAGSLGDRMGIRMFFKAGIVIFTLSSLLCTFSVSAGWLIGARFLQGIGAALGNATGSAILVMAFPPQYRGRVLGISVAGVYLGLAIGPFFGGILTQSLGWKSIFYLAVILGFAASLISFIFLGKDTKSPTEPKKTDFQGIAAFMIGLMTLVYGSSQIPQFHGWILLASGLVILFFFWNIESRAVQPIFNTRLFTENRLFAFSNLAALINYTATFAIVFILSLFLQRIQGLSPSEAGMILVSQPLVMAIFSPITGRLSDRIQARYLASLGMAICASGLLALSFLSPSTPVWLITSILIFVGLGFALFSSPNMNTIMGSVERTQYGLASGTSSTMRVLGQIVSMTIVTLFFTFYFGDKSVEHIEIDTFMKVVRGGFSVFAAINFAGIYFSYARGKSHFSSHH